MKLPAYFQVVAEIKIWEDKPNRLLLESCPISIEEKEKYDSDKELCLIALLQRNPWYIDHKDRIENIQTTIDILIKDNNGKLISNNPETTLIEYSKGLMDTVK